MKKLLLSLIIGLGLLTGCTSGSSEDNVIKVGATVSPHAEILNDVVKDLLEEAGYTLEVVEYTDYVLPNTAVNDGELDANYFQHVPYLEDFNAENGTDLVSVAEVHFEPLGIYAGKTDALQNIQDGATIAIPNDTTNEARALLLLQYVGLIELDEDAGLQATILDITNNPYNLQFSELEAAQLVRSLQDVDFAVINGNYAIEGGLSVSDALEIEATDSEAAETYANVIAVKAGNEDTEKTQALVEAIQSDEVKEYIEENYNGSVVTVY